MFNIETKILASAMSAAKQLKSDAAILCAGKHGVLFATRSDAGTFLQLLTDEKQQEATTAIRLEELGNALYRLADVEMEIGHDTLIIKSKKIRSIIRLTTERQKSGNLLELWDKRNEAGNEVPALSRMLRENASLFNIKDHVGGKPVPVHLRWNKKGVAAGMSDQYHGISISTENAVVEKEKSRELYVFSSWLPLLIEYLTTGEIVDDDEKEKSERGKNKKKKSLPAPTLSITESQVMVATQKNLLVLTAIVPGADTINLDEIQEIAAQESKNKIKLNMSDCNGALKRSLAVLPNTAAIKLTSSLKKPETLRIEGTHDSGSKIIEEIATSRTKKDLQISCTIYNLLDITNAAVPECSLSMAGRALLLSYTYGAKSDTVYSVKLFSAIASN